MITKWRAYEESLLFVETYYAMLANSIEFLILASYTTILKIILRRKKISVVCTKSNLLRLGHVQTCPWRCAFFMIASFTSTREAHYEGIITLIILSDTDMIKTNFSF